MLPEDIDRVLSDADAANPLHRVKKRGEFSRAQVRLPEKVASPDEGLHPGRVVAFSGPVQEAEHGCGCDGQRREGWHGLAAACSVGASRRE